MSDFMNEDFVYLLNDCQSNVELEPSSGFQLQNFDRPHIRRDGEDPTLNMVRYDPQYDVQAQIRNTLIKSYSAFMNHIDQ